MSTEKWNTGTGKYSLLVVMKGEHRYIIKYDPSHKEVLLDLLLEYGQSDEYNLSPFDALALMEKMGTAGSSSSVISLGEDNPVIEKDLTFDNPLVEPESGRDFGLREP